MTLRPRVWLPSTDAVEQWAILFEIFGSESAGEERYSVDLRSQAGLMFVSLVFAAPLHAKRDFSDDIPDYGG